MAAARSFSHPAVSDFTRCSVAKAGSPQELFSIAARSRPVSADRDRRLRSGGTTLFGGLFNGPSNVVTIHRLMTSSKRRPEKKGDDVAVQISARPELVRFRITYYRLRKASAIRRPSAAVPAGGAAAIELDPGADRIGDCWTVPDGYLAGHRVIISGTALRA